MYVGVHLKWKTAVISRGPEDYFRAFFREFSPRLWEYYVEAYLYSDAPEIQVENQSLLTGAYSPLENSVVARAGDWVNLIVDSDDLAIPVYQDGGIPYFPSPPG